MLEQLLHRTVSMIRLVEWGQWKVRLAVQSPLGRQSLQLDNSMHLMLIHWGRRIQATLSEFAKMKEQLTDLVLSFERTGLLMILAEQVAALVVLSGSVQRKEDDS